MFFKLTFSLSIPPLKIILTNWPHLQTGQMGEGTHNWRWYGYVPLSRPIFSGHFFFPFPQEHSSSAFITLSLTLVGGKRTMDTTSPLLTPNTLLQSWTWCIIFNFQAFFSFQKPTISSPSSAPERPFTFFRKKCIFKHTCLFFCLDFNSKDKFLQNLIPRP